MTQRSPAVVFILSIITFGIYALVWVVKTKDEMNARGASIPTAWLLIVPIANLWWMWKYSEGVGQVTNNQTSAGLAFVLMFFLGVIGYAILQSSFNKVGGAAPPTSAAVA